MSNPSPSYYAIIPAHIRYCKELEPAAKLLYGEITALCHAEGYCWATNKYFADLYDVDESTIKRWILSLKSQKFIVVEVEKSGFQTSRKIWISLEVKKMFTTAQKCAPDGSKMSPRQLKNELHNSTLNSTYEKKERDGEQAPQTPSVSPFFTLNQITMAQEDYDELCTKFGADVVKAKVEEFDDYSRSQPQQFKKYKCHASTIRQWIRRDQKADSSKPTKPADTNRAFLDKIKTKFAERNDMYFSPEGLVIYSGNAQKIFKLSDHGFKDQVMAYLRLMKLPMEDL